MRSELREFAERTGVNILYFDELSSTNDEATNGAYPAGTIVITEHQSAGRGQRGNSWKSNQGENLTFSVVLEPTFLEAQQQFYISKVVALALCDTLRKIGLQPEIKWPNDIYTKGRKIAGILIENDLAGHTICRSIAGIGLNVNQLQFDSSLPNPTSIAINKGLQDRVKILESFYLNLAIRYQSLIEEQHQTIDHDYLGMLYRLNVKKPFIEPLTGERFYAVIRGVLPTGELCVEHTEGEVRNYLFKEIEFTL